MSAWTQSALLATVVPDVSGFRYATAGVVLMRSNPLDVPTALSIGRETLRKMRQNLAWAVG